MTISSFRWKLWVEGKEFFNKPGARKSSIRGFKSGILDNEYYDFDNITSNSSQAKNVVTQLSYKIKDINNELNIDYLAFIEKKFGGTAGALRASLAISIYTDLPNILIRPHKEVKFDRIKIPDRRNLPRKSQLSGLNIVLITDHITTGSEVVKSAEIIRNNGGNISDVVAYSTRLDRLEIEKFNESKLKLHYIYEVGQVANEQGTIE